MVIFRDFGITSIKEKAFEDNEQIESVVFPDSLETIENCAFSGCSNITEIKLNEGLTSIEWDAFRGTGLSRVFIPYSVEEIGPSAFKCEMEVESINTDYCANDGVLYSFDEDQLVIYPANREDVEFEVPDSVDDICDFAFEDSSLKSLTLPESIKTLGRSIFGSDSEITKLTINIDDPNELDIDENAFEGFSKDMCRLIVPYGCSANYFSHEQFKGFLSISELQVESTTGTNLQSGYVAGQYFKTLYEDHLAESKAFCLHEGKNYCYVAMTFKGFFLKIIGGGYFFLSDHISDYKSGNIWIQNKKGSLSSYNVSYTTDGVNPRAFGHFTESYAKRTLSYRDLKTGASFTLDLKTGEKI